MEPSEYITDQARLDALCDSCRRQGWFAFDTEFIRDDTFEAILCLVQVATGEEVVLIDPTGNVDIDVFWNLVTDPNVLKVVHAGKEDFDVCLNSMGQPPRNVFDVQIAAGFAGFSYPLSLTRLVDQVLGRRIAKGETLTDWLRRPLTPDQMRYAVEDVAHLPAAHQRLLKKLERSGRTAWAQEEFRCYEDAEFYRPPTESRLFRLKGSRKLDALGLEVLGRMVDWREAWARDRNRPVRAMMRDDVMVDIARRKPSKVSELEVMRGFPQARNRKITAQILAIVCDARRAPRESWPQPDERRDETPMDKAVMDLLSAVTRGICVAQGVSQELVRGKVRFQELVDFVGAPGDAQPALLRGWRAEFIGRQLLELIRGNRQLHLSGWPANPRIELVAHGCDGPQHGETDS